MKKFALLLIIAGAAVLLYPKAEDIYYAQQEQNIIDEYRELDELFTTYDDPECIGDNCDISVIENEIESLEITEAENWNNSSHAGNNEGGDSGEDVQAQEENSSQGDVSNEGDPQAEDKVQGDIAGLITIEKIDLMLPVLYGANSEQLSRGAGYLTESGKIGEVGNAAIAAHRSHTYGRQFNRLGEIEPGDEVKVKVPGKGTFTYKVFDIKIVKPEDTSVLKPIDNKSVLTLITCDPVTNPTHRLIVHAEKKS